MLAEPLQVGHKAFVLTKQLWWLVPQVKDHLRDLDARK